jgi:uncharacterized protein (DUF427 family)
MNRGCTLIDSRKERLLMEDIADNEFRRPVTLDEAPAGSVCEWCGKPASYLVIAVGGKHHNEEAYLCFECGQSYIRAVAESINRVPVCDVTV